MKNIKIAIIDNGINIKLLKNICQKVIFIDESNKCKGDYAKLDDLDFQHGTICALVLENYYPNCKLSSIRILDKAGKGEIEKLEPALEWCCQNNMRLINLSLGTTHFREHDRLNTLINKYTSKGLIIVAATSNIGFCTYPASFANVIGVATIGNPLQYCSDFVHLGIDTVVPSEHTVSLYDTEFKTPVSNSYAVPYVCAILARKIAMDKICDIHSLKRYVSSQSQLIVIADLYNPDWIYKAYMLNRKNKSRAKYFFEEVIGNLEDIKHEIDTIIIYSSMELEQIDIGNKNLIYLGKADFKIENLQGFEWSWNTRVKQILNNQYHRNGLDIPIIILDIEDSLDQYYVLSLFRQLFENEGYNAYAIGMEPESILYRFEYIPDIQIPLTNQIIKDFIAGQIHYKQSDLILWSVTKEQKLKVCGIYPDYDIEIIFNKAEILVYIERNLIYKQTYDVIVYKYIMAIYSIIKNCLTEDKYE